MCDRAIVIVKTENEKRRFVMKVQAFCEEKGLRSFLGVFGYAESKNQLWQAGKRLLHHLICIFPRWPPKLRKTSIAANWYMFRIPNCYKIIKKKHFIIMIRRSSMNKKKIFKVKRLRWGGERAGVWAFLLVPTKVIIFPL